MHGIPWSSLVLALLSHMETTFQQKCGPSHELGQQQPPLRGQMSKITPIVECTSISSFHLLSLDYTLSAYFKLSRNRAIAAIAAIAAIPAIAVALVALVLWLLNRIVASDMIVNGDRALAITQDTYSVPTSVTQRPSRPLPPQAQISAPLPRSIPETRQLED